MARSKKDSGPPEHPEQFPKALWPGTGELRKPLRLPFLPPLCLLFCLPFCLSPWTNNVRIALHGRGESLPSRQAIRGRD